VNGERLAFAKMDEARARSLERRSSWALELTIRPTEYREWKDRNQRTMRARIVSARLFTSQVGEWDGAEIIADVKGRGDRPLCGVVLEPPQGQAKAARKR
jgi:hypothetical protein